jgi:glycosyltransferase involved in cell wall biosynthesis
MTSSVARAPRALTLVVPGALDTPTGGYAYDRHMARELEARGWAVDVVVLEGGYPWPNADAVAAADRALAAVPDGRLTLCDGLAFGALPAVAGRHAARLRLIALVHHPLAAETGLDASRRAGLFAAEREALRAARHVVVTSRATATQLAAYGVRPDGVTAVEPGVAPAPLAHGSRAADPAAPVALLCVASLIPRKGHDVLIAALGRVTAPHWRLTCVGSAELAPDTAHAVRCQVDAAGLSSRVTFTGALAGDALAAQYHRADVFVLASHYEGYGMAVAEAVARGLPVIATDAGASADLVDARSGVLVRPGDVAGLTSALERAVGDDAERSRLAAGARARRLALPDWRAAAARLDAVLERMLEHGALRR